MPAPVRGVLAAALAAVALSGEPECPSAPAACLAATAADLCDSTAWELQDACLARCPNHLRVDSGISTTTPARLCLQPDAFTAVDPNRTLSLTHTLNSMALPVTTPAGTGAGCAVGEYTNTAEGSIVIVPRGPCEYAVQAREAAAAGARALIIIHDSNDDRYLADVYPPSGGIVGSDRAVGIPVALLGKADGEAMLAALRRSPSGGVRGAWVFTCDAAVAPPVAILPAWREHDRCPLSETPGGDVQATCGGEAEASRRLCAACPLSMRLGGGGDGAITICLHSNRLLPRVEKNVLQGVFGAAPFEIPAGELVVVDTDALPAGGCAMSDYPAALASKVLAMDRPTRCVAATAVAAAQAAGAAGVIVMARTTAAADGVYRVRGSSAFINIPVHAVSLADATALRAYAAASGGDVGVVRVEASVGASGGGGTGGAAPAAPGDTADAPSPRARAVPQKSVTEKVFAYVIIPVLVVLLLVLCLKVWQNVAAARAVVPGDDDTRGWYLSACSIALSLTLVFLILAIGIVLTRNAGTRASDRAIDDSEHAATQAYDVAISNIEQLGLQLRSTLHARVAVSLTHAMGDGGMVADTVVAAYADLEANTYPAFVALLSRFTDIVGALVPPATMATTAAQGVSGATMWVPTYHHLWGYWAAGSPSATVYLHQGGAAASAPVEAHEYRAAERAAVKIGEHDPAVINRERAVARGLYGDASRACDFKPDRFRRWTVHGAVPDTLAPHKAAGALVLYTPSMNRDFRRMGVVGVELSLESLRGLLERAQIEAQLPSATFAVLAAPTREVITSNAVRLRCVAAHPGYTRAYLTRPHTLASAPSAELNALGVLLNSSWNVRASYGVTRVLRDVLPRREGTLFAFAADQAGGVDAVRDAGAHGWRASPAPTTRDPKSGRRVMRLDGRGGVEIHRHLTTDAPLVAQTYTSNADGSWNSSYPPFQHGVVALADGKGDCVAHPGGVGIPGDGCYYRHPGFGGPARDGQRASITVVFRPAARAAAGAAAPRVFSNAVGGGGVVLYANGRMTLNTQCDIPALSGGVPLDGWTTLTAVWDDDAGYCAVYANGTLHRRAVMAPKGEVDVDVAAATAASPAHVVGQYFTGDIDYVVAHDYALSWEEVQGVHGMAAGHTGSAVGFDAAPGSAEWYMDVHPYNKTEVMVAGVDWLIAVLLPRVEVVRRVVADSDALLADLRGRHATTREQLDRDISETLMIAIALCLLCCLIFMIYNERVTKQFEHIARVTLNVSVMRIDLDEVHEADSWIAELYALQKALWIMSTNLYEYRAFVEQSALVDSDSGSEAGTSGAVAGVAVQAGGAEADDTPSDLPSPHSPHSPRSRSTGSPQGLSAADKYAMSTPPDGTGVGCHARDLSHITRLMLKLCKKPFSMTMINVRGFHSKMDVMGDSEALIAFAAGIIHDVAGVCFEARGVMETLSGDHFTLSFGAAKRNAMHAMSAAMAADAVRARLAERVSVYAAVVTGVGLLGNAGTNEMKKYTFFAPEVSYAEALLSFAGCVQRGILCAAPVQAKATHVLRFRLVAAVRFEKVERHGHLMVYEILGQRDGPFQGGDGGASGGGGPADAPHPDNEWMYDAAPAPDTRDPAAAWDEYTAAIFLSDWDRATLLRPAAERAYPGDNDSFLATALRRALERQVYTVVDLAVPYPSAVTWDHWMGLLDTPATPAVVEQTAEGAESVKHSPSLVLAAPEAEPSAGSGSPSAGPSAASTPMPVRAPTGDVFDMMAVQAERPLFDPAPPTRVANVARDTVTAKMGAGESEGTYTVTKYVRRRGTLRSSSVNDGGSPCPSSGCPSPAASVQWRGSPASSPLELPAQQVVHAVESPPDNYIEGGA